MSHESFDPQETEYQRHLRDEAEVRWATTVVSAQDLKFADCVEFAPNRDEANLDLTRLEHIHGMLKDLTLVKVKIDTRAFAPPARESIPLSGPFAYGWRVDIVALSQCGSYRVEHTVEGIKAYLI